MSTSLVDTDSQLAEVCDRIGRAAHVALDTEFIRQRTFRPQLCLIQIAVGEQIHCIDPLALRDLSGLMQALSDVEIVIHSARQDIEALYQSTGIMLGAVFDTQIAAGLTGLGDQVSYSSLVSELLGVELGKGETRTNWAQRPLTAAQKRYAEDDVRYLLQLYPLLLERLKSQSRLEWLQQECAMLSNVNLYRHDPETAWSKVRGTRPLSRAQRRSMKRLAAWREQQAWDKDKPRKWIMSDETLVNIAASEPDSPEDVADLLDDRQRFLRQSSEALFRELKRAEQDPVEPPFKGNDPEETRLIKSCMNVLRSAATSAGISPSLLGTRKDVTNVVRGEPSPLLHSWRHDLVGKALENTIAEARDS